MADDTGENVARVTVCVRVGLERLKVRYHLVDLSENGDIILKQMVRTCTGRVGFM
jgi:hypothetical protein